jgi:predicted HicB family RNase H-like nuclease
MKRIARSLSQRRTRRDFSSAASGKGGEAVSGAGGARLSDPIGNNAMTNIMNYKGYSARIEYDDDDGILFGQLAGISDGIGFHADSVEDLRLAFQEAVDDYLATCAKLGKEPQKAYSGKVMFRIDPEVHARAAKAAELAGKSLNEWAGEVLAKAAG